MTVYHESDFYLREGLNGIRIFSAGMLEHRVGHLLTFFQLRQKLRQNALKSTDTKITKALKPLSFKAFLMVEHSGFEPLTSTMRM